MDEFLGEIRIWPGVRPPNGWSFCDGKLLPIQGNDALYAVLGTTYGGDGRTTFGLPNLSGRLPIHQGQGVNLTNRPLSSTGGAIQAVADVPAHTHTLNAANTASGASQTSPQGTLLSNCTNSFAEFVKVVGTPTVSQMSSLAVSQPTINSGITTPHNNVMPNMLLNYIICITGVFPVRN